ncbi:MAG: AmmeMemoRadiSam system protein B [Chloroflexota bacterium]
MDKPLLRNLQPQMIQHRGKPAILLRDPLRLTSRAVALPAQLALLLGLCDGSRDPAGIRAALEIRAGVRVSQSSIESILREMDEALLFDNERFAAALAVAGREYRQAAFRTPGLAGESYPSDPDELRGFLRGYVEGLDPAATPVASPEAARGLISPHIDYQRGGAVYARVWSAAEQALASAELIVVLGTDHLGGGFITLTRQHYATPWGTLLTALNVVDAIAEAIGPDVAYRDEIHHRTEHSIELAMVWLHYVLGDRSPAVLPILCGSFDPFMESENDPSSDETIGEAVRVLRKAIAGRKSIVVAAADLAHVGPAFGDRYPMDFARRARVKGADEVMLQLIRDGDAEGFFQQLRDERDARKVCGLPPIYMMLRLLGDGRGTLLDYALCPADNQNTSFVSICGMLLS